MKSSTTEGRVRDTLAPGHPLSGCCIEGDIFRSYQIQLLPFLLARRRSCIPTAYGCLVGSKCWKNLSSKRVLKYLTTA